ncbi:Threonine--tRNA ligase [compost metagenome]
MEIQTPEDTLGARIRRAQNQKIPYMLVVGEKEIQSKQVAVRSRSKGDLGAIGLAEFAAQAKSEVEKRSTA